MTKWTTHSSWEKNPSQLHLIITLWITLGRSKFHDSQPYGHSKRSCLKYSRTRVAVIFRLRLDHSHDAFNLCQLGKRKESWRGWKMPIVCWMQHVNLLKDNPFYSRDRRSYSRNEKIRPHTYDHQHFRLNSPTARNWREDFGIVKVRPQSFVLALTFPLGRQPTSILSTASSARFPPLILSSPQPLSKPLKTKWPRKSRSSSPPRFPRRYRYSFGYSMA